MTDGLAKVVASDVVTEFGSRIDCAENGCPDLHDDNGAVIPWRSERLPQERRINGHATTLVRRTVTYSSWEDAEADSQRAGLSSTGRGPDVAGSTGASPRVLSIDDLFPPKGHRYLTDERIEELRKMALSGDTVTLPATTVMELVSDWRNMTWEASERKSGPVVKPQPDYLGRRR